MRRSTYVLRLYPRPWRDRYEDEVLAMLEQGVPSWMDDLNLLGGAFNAHLHPCWGFADKSSYLRTLRGSLLTIFVAYASFIIAGLAYQKLTEYHAFMSVAQTDHAIGLLFLLVVIGSVLALSGIFVGGVPIVVAVIRHALKNKQPGLLFLLSTPILANGIFLCILLLLKNIHPIIPLETIISRTTFVGALLITVAVSTGVVCRAVSRCEIPEPLLRFALRCAMLATAAMALMFVATTVWGLGVWSKEPQLFTRNDGIFGTSTPLTWLGIVMAMAMATAIALLALTRGMSSRAVLNTTMQESV
ncbi:hypothetical protein KDA_55930 [Dictyobacter alpinus]|uniref:Uncharacterized protein n=1 Tax=Dictyobacter alpinus TaxID=2014873 RepID=A0A402BFJ4_9CHLR|nr:hypothetical protein [Dictyobacter alpinus]GCE30109.1 hypothetical protein KDA_55930 [Dictyobacter alpinus]